MSPHFVPLGDRILIRPDSPEVMAGLIHLPKDSREKPKTGVIISMGPNVKGNLSKGPDMKDLSVGTRVLFSNYAGIDINLDGVDHLILLPDSLHGTFPK